MSQAGVAPVLGQQQRTGLALSTCAAVFFMTVMASSLPATEVDEVRKYTDSGDVVPFEQVVDAVREKFAGRIIETELEREDGRLIYKIEMLDTDGRLKELEYDAKTGVLLKQEYED